MRYLLLLSGIVLALPMRASATISYSITFWNGGSNAPTYSANTPIQRDTSFALAPSNGTGIFTGSAYAGAGYLAGLGRVECTWGGGFSGAFSGRTDVSVNADDFIISGPPGPPVNGTMHFRVRVSLGRTGGFPGNGGHNATFTLYTSTLYSGTNGSIVSSNYSNYGNGCFSSVSGPDVDMVLSVSGNFPVNQYFTFSLSTYYSGATYGNVFNNPGMCESNGGSTSLAGRGVQWVEVGGKVMTLPAGYTFNTASFGVTNNHYQNAAAVEGARMVMPQGLRVVGRNPSAGESRLALSLAEPGRVRVGVYGADGRMIRRLFDGWRGTGTGEISWDGRAADGARAPAGVYIIRAQSGATTMSAHVVRVK